MQYDIGIVIVSYNVRNFLAQCLDSIRKSLLKGLSTQIWVVDNASVDGSVALIRAEYPEVHIIENNTNVGFSKANNQAIRSLNSKYILLLNPDTIIEEDTLYKCYQFMQQHPKCGAMGVRMLDGAGRFLPESKRKIPDLWNSFCKMSYLSAAFPKSRWFSGYNLGYIPEDETAQIEVLCGAFMFIRSETLDNTGLLDERFFMYGEDIDLSYRILKSGYEIWYYPESSIIHYKGESTRKSSLKYVKNFYGAMITYVNKHYSKGNAKVFAMLIRMAILIRAFMSAAGRLLNNIWWPLFDFFIIYAMLISLKTWWSAYYHKVHDYYPADLIRTTFILISFIWVLSAAFFGKYDAKTPLRHLITGFTLTLLGILVLYGLAPESWRASRFLVFAGSVMALIYSVLSYFLFEFLDIRGKQGNTHSEKNIAIVAFKEAAEKIVKTLKRAEIPFKNIFFIAPQKGLSDSFYVNDFSALKHMIKPLQINEVIFSTESMQLKEIIQAMGGLGSDVSIKIGGNDNLNIIGSNSRNYAGEYYSIDFSYNLNKSANKRFKRTADIVFSLLFLIMLPLLATVIQSPGKFLAKLLSVLSGEKSWVGYGGIKEDYEFLPVIPEGLIPYPDTIGTFRYVPEFYKNANLDYARHYTVLKDVRLILKFAVPFTMISKDYDIKE